MSEETKNTEQQPDNSTPEENGGNSGEKLFTQEDVNRIVSERLAREREKATQPPQEDEREKELKAREARLDCRDYLDSKKYPTELMDVLDITDVEIFKTTVEKLAKAFPEVFAKRRIPPPYAAGTGSMRLLGADVDLSSAFKPPIT